MQFRMEMFNLLNHPNFAPPGPETATRIFSTPTGAHWPQPRRDSGHLAIDDHPGTANPICCEGYLLASEEAFPVLVPANSGGTSIFIKTAAK